MRCNFMKKILKTGILLSFILINQCISGHSIDATSKWEGTMRTDFPRDFDLFERFKATEGYKYRQNKFLNHSDDPAVKIYLNEEVDDDKIESGYDALRNVEGMNDFTLCKYVRYLYLNINKNILSQEQQDDIIDAYGKAKYWFTYSTKSNTAIVYTENHQILSHSTEYLIGQLFPDDVFDYTKMTGKEHAKLAKERILKWLDWRSRLGFSEWNSHTYLNPDIASLVNLVDFALDEEIVVKAAMVLDLIAFGFASHYFKNTFATSMGRCYDRNRINMNRDATGNIAWLMLGIGKRVDVYDDRAGATVALATSDHYAPPPILEAIANDSKNAIEHKERHNIGMDEGDEYGIEYNEEDMMYWWGQSGPVAPETIKESFNMLEKYNIEPNTLFGPQALVDFIKFSSFLHGMSLSEYSKTLELITKGVCLETANIYTYRTSDYQLSGAQDHMKGMNGMQELIWQASLSDDAYILTGSPGGITQKYSQLFMGSWKPRATLHKNVGIIQYDRERLPIEGELLTFMISLYMGASFYTHAYFPRSNFDEVQTHGQWTFGAEDDGYVAFYCHEPYYWSSDFEMRSNGAKNVYIVELASEDDYASFDDFIKEILKTDLKIKPETLGYNVSYKSPSQGRVKVRWDGEFEVDGEEIDLGDYDRFDNKYCHQEFGTAKTVIEFEGERLELNFYNNTRLYQG